MNATDYANKLRDTATERELATRLRSLPEEDRIRFVVEMLDVHLMVALELANKCLKTRESFVQLLEIGLARTKDLSSINLWLQIIVPKLGVRRVVELLRDTLKTQPFAVGSTLYFVPSYIEADDVKSKAAFDELCDAAKHIEVGVPK